MNCKQKLFYQLPQYFSIAYHFVKQVSADFLRTDTADGTHRPVRSCLGRLTGPWGTEQRLVNFRGQKVTCLPGTLPQTRILIFGCDGVIFSHRFSQ